VPNKPTLRDVAQLAKVSLGTASQALSNKAGVLPETRAKVLEAARSLGYQHTVRTSSPMSQSLTTIGLLTKSNPGDVPALNSFYTTILAGAERECRRAHINLMYANIEVDEHSHALALPPMILDQRVDGVLIAGAFLGETLATISKQYIQTIVLVDAYIPGQLFDSVVIDNVNGAQAAVEYMIEQGHRKIGLIGSCEDDYPSIRERRKGYIRALRENGIEDLYIEESILTREAAYEATGRLLERAPELTAIFACNDDVAVGVMNAANRLGLRVPDDLSVVGFDDIDLAQELNPPLTTVHVDKVLMGALAVRTLQDRAEHPQRTAITTSVSTQLIVRGSVRPLKR
jgi:DNA-binding LacI/PurR family transcriptional regulator